MSADGLIKEENVCPVSPDLSAYVELKFPHFTEPREVGYFSLNEDRQLSVDKSELKYLLNRLHVDDLQLGVSYCSKRHRFDLNKGIDAYLKTYKEAEKNKSEEFVDSILQWLLKVKLEEEKKSQSAIGSLRSLCFDVEFVCWRGLLTKLASTPYDRQDGWILHAVRYNDVVFLCEIESEAKKQRRLQMTDRDAKFTYWGHNFESFCVTDQFTNNLSLADQNMPMNNQKAFVTAVKSKLNGKTLLFCGEVDAVDTLGCYVELKTNRMIETQRQEDNFRRKLLKWFLQSFLVKIGRVVVGFRDDGGIVRDLQQVYVKAMQGMAKQFWSAAACMNFLDAMLSHIQKTVGPNEVYRWEFDPQKRRITEVKIGPDTNGYAFIPPWFCKEFDQKSYPSGPVPQSPVKHE